MDVRELMNAEPARLPPEAPLSEALRLMAERRHRHVVVVDGDERVVGILSDRDLALYYDPAGMTEEKWAAARVEQLMTPEPICIGSGADIHDAARELLRSAVSALPVVDNGLLVGILTDRDYVRHFARSAPA